MRKCTLCEKGSVIGGKRAFLRSHYNPTARVRKYPNLQWTRSANGTRIKACVRCIKTAAKKVA